jgi:hypothetical protein
VQQPEKNAGADARNGQHDFDFEFGAWTVRLSRLVSPLSGSDEWVEYEGTSVVRRVWGGRANLGELRVSGPTGELEGLSLRLYDPGSGQWRISWANRADGLLGEPMVGGFEGGRGEFLNYERWNDREILVRFVFSDITADSFRFEQAFSDDHGRAWEPNWIAVFTRVDDASPDPEVGLSPIAPGVVPGHGEPAGPGLLDHTLTLLSR